MAAIGNIKTKAGTDETKGGFYVQALSGDFHIDTYKTNMFSETYTKISCKGTPAESDQALPYADAGHHGIEINSPDGIHLDAKNISMDGTTNLSLSGGTIGLKSAGDVGITGGTVGIDDVVRMAEGRGTSTANSTFSATDGARSVQKPLKDAQISVQEVATVVSPGELPKSKAQKPAVVKRSSTFITSTMSIGEGE